MAVKFEVSELVKQSLIAQAKGQLNTLCAVILDPSVMDDRYPSALLQAGNAACITAGKSEKTLKTWANYVSAARVVLPRLAAQFPVENPDISVLSDWLFSSLKKGHYFTQCDDVARWAKGLPSISATKAKAKAAPAPAPAPDTTAEPENFAAVVATIEPVATPAPAPAPAATTELLSVTLGVDGSIILDHGATLAQLKAINLLILDCILDMETVPA